MDSGIRDKANKIIERIKDTLSVHEYNFFKSLFQEKKSPFQRDKTKCQNLVKTGRYKGKPHCTVFKSICPSKCKEEEPRCRLVGGKCDCRVTCDVQYLGMG